MCEVEEEAENTWSEHAEVDEWLVSCIADDGSMTGIDVECS